MKEFIKKFMGNVFYKEHVLYVNGEDLQYFMDKWSDMRYWYKLSDSLIGMRVIRTTSNTVKYKIIFSLTKNAWRLFIDNVTKDGRKILITPIEEMYLY